MSHTFDSHIAEVCPYSHADTMSALSQRIAAQALEHAKWVLQLQAGNPVPEKDAVSRFGKRD